MQDTSGQVELVLGGEPRPEALLSEGADSRVQELELNVRRASHGYLEGHSVQGTPVVPMVLVAEWLARAARCFRPGLALLALHELKVLKGIRLPGFENGGDHLLIQARPLPSSEGAQLQLQVRDRASGALHYSARAELRAQPGVPDAGRPGFSMEAWHGAPLYSGLQPGTGCDNLLFHRGKFELIECLDGISDQGVEARLRGVEHAGWQAEPWQLDVAALDGGMQLAVLYGQRMLGGPNLPTAIQEIRCFATPPGQGLISATAYGRKLGAAGVSTDILFTDEQGRRLIELHGVQNYALPRA